MTGVALERPPEPKPCTECMELFLPDVLQDCSELAPLAGDCCPECTEELVECGHFDTCDCSACVRQRLLADLVARMAAIEPGAVALP